MLRRLRVRLHDRRQTHRGRCCRYVRFGRVPQSPN
ncbi:hypothetical protein F444_15110 [Phytophthora nicotianae P1976]|uniref:Uncharacterized protein n=1 Tax=Phytophthora nicotianae P1976 TaxID=1317066 RepID=A0A080ZN17_PHYNI|nr:hypothetical protein F444_15110 [Phytophthora nicotianae P1976]